MTRPDQTRPDQTRPDQTAVHDFQSLKAFFKRIDRFHIVRTVYRLFSSKYHDRVHYNFSSKVEYSKTPYIIRKESSVVGGMGLCSFLISVAGGIAYAEKKGYTPVVDMKHYPNVYLYASEVGKVNSWEYYFEQPDSISLEEALSCRKYIIGKDLMMHHSPSQSSLDFYNRDGKLDYWRGICKKYIRFSKPVLDGIEHESQKFAGKRVLGVSVRGTDYTAIRPHGHPVQPTIEQAVAKAREVFGTGSYDAVYLATEDKNIIAAFREAFGEKLILPDRDAIDYDPSAGKWITECFDDRRQNDKYLTGLEYLVSMLMLTKCTGLITSKTAGSTSVMCLSDGWEYLYVFDLGLYE